MLLTRRLRKQILYGALFASIPLVVYFFLLRQYFVPAPNMGPQSPESPWTPITVEETVVLSHRNPSALESSSIDLVTPLRNPNARAGVEHYRIRYVLYNTTGAEITTAQDEVYILPGALQYAMAFNVTIPSGQQLGRIQVITPEPKEVTFLPIADLSVLPSFNVFLRGREQKAIGNAAVTDQKGIVTNNSTFAWQTVEVRAVALDSANDIVAAGKTVIGRLETGEQREFTIQWPSASAPITQVIALASTNIFSDANFIQSVGDPGGLR